MEIIIDWKAINTEEEFYKLFLPQVKAPEWHGHNLDALNDSLVNGDINSECPPYKIKNINVSSVPENIKSFQRAVLSIFADSTIECSGNEITFG